MSEKVMLNGNVTSTVAKNVASIQIVSGENIQIVSVVKTAKHIVTMAGMPLGMQVFVPSTTS